MGQGAPVSAAHRRATPHAARRRARRCRSAACRATRGEPALRPAAGSARTPSAGTGCATRSRRRCRRPPLQRRAGVIIVGAGIAGLAAARALRRAGIDDVHLLDLEDAAGGNSRGHRIAAWRCPLGAHYLPVPGEHAIEVDRAARRARPAPHRARPRGLRRAPPVPQPAGAPATSTASGTTACCRRRRAAEDSARHAGAVPPLRRGRRRARARAARSAMPTARCGVERRRTRRSTRITVRRLARRARPRRAGAALVPRLLLPRRLRRRRGAGLGLGRAALLREPPRLSRARRRRQRRSATAC